MFMSLVRNDGRSGMKQGWGMLIGTVLVALGLMAPPAGAKVTLREQTVVKRFDRLVVRYHRHLTRESPGGATCERTGFDRFACAGRWKAVAVKDGVRTRFVYDARGAAKKDLDEMVVWARMKRWEIADGKKRGPIRGTVLKAYYPRDWPTVEIG